ncbi:uncharacterized protein J4E84_002259 [Alternaria hordeiaustralica]|uniref:uncharacterized protein n=1 Tax=Alternaria hordeiaustralica TaxID=1187925 RepID=UPI0020C45407|nr:uncharacterized protein J4E84_002259 [Alternaria hordeiaustralica]KAI4693685.1 hypothetical protein J4E84_002259 [Alternaria hordeiaustralica]
MPAPLAKAYPTLFLLSRIPLLSAVLSYANLLAGTGPRFASPQGNTQTPPHRPNHPFTSGLIIAASVIVAAGIAIYESPQVRQWADQTRRKIAIALHNLGDDIQPRRPSESSDDFEARKQRREELIRRNRNELIRRAREEGIAVDLDELARIGAETAEVAARRSRADRTRSFDDMVGSDGMLRDNATATGTGNSNGNLKKRGAAGFAAGSAAAATMANPFSDDQVLFDHDEDEAPSPKPFTYEEPAARESSATIVADVPSTPTTGTLVDLTPDPEHSLPETPSPAQPAQEDADQAAQSFYSFTSSQAGEPTPSHPFFDDNDAEHLSTGTLTPRSERSMTMSGSVASAHANDIAILSMPNSEQNDTDHDARSESGFTDAFSEGGFSEFDGDRQGIMTPTSWTDVGSDDDSEWGGAGQAGHVSQIHQ